MIDVGLLPRRVGAARELQAGEARIAEIARVGGRHRVAAEPEEAERAALEAVRDLLAAAADFGQIVAVAGAFEKLALLVRRLAGQRIVPRRNRAPRSAPCSPPKSETRTRTRQAAWRCRAARCLRRCRGSPVTSTSRPNASRLKNMPRERPERRIELALEGGLEPGDVDAKIAQQALGDGAVERFRRLQRLAAAIADDAAAVEGELVALGVAAEIVVIVENQDAGGRLGAAVEPRRRKPADAAADHDEVVGLLDRQAIDRKFAPFSCERMGGLERAFVLAAQPRQRGRVACRLRRELRRRRQAGRDRQSCAVEKIAPGDR